MLVHRFLEQSARRAPGDIALVEPQRSIAYGDLDRLANRFANVFAGAGVRRGDRVVIALDNCVELVGAYMGALKAGAAAVPLPAGPRNDRLATALVDCRPTACVVDAAAAAEATDGHPLAGVHHLFVLRGRHTAGAPLSVPATAVEDALAVASDQAPNVRAIDLDLAAIIYTSGSTGSPRGVMLTHRNIVSNTRSIVAYLRLTARDRVMCVLPFYYVYGLSLLHTHLAAGGSVVIDNRFAFPNVVLSAMREHRVTGFAGVPSTFALLLHRSNLDGMALPDLRYVTQAGGGMPTGRVREWLARGPRAAFYVMYGATEASARLTYLDPAELPRKLGSIGRPIPNVEILVVKDNGGIAGPGEVGELVARGSNIACGYWNNPEETREKFGPLGYRTGDLGSVDEEGFLFLVGRRHDMIKVGAHRVGAKEIEDVLQEHPAVHEAAVIGTPHDILGEVPIAFVALRQPLDQTATEVLRAFCARRLPPHKVPARFVFAGELPKIPGIGKIDKRALREPGVAGAAPALGAATEDRGSRIADCGPRIAD
ncbi:MAG: class I adenylate-forming enzyme family protein [Vicinamibacterales bacterium]